ncbi:hypothetical protein KIH23_02570 [Flavobacterium sp. CYK-55]|uniref:hypothetical protein n=1 Tax=Flavobacterium sp. CYK-55 TaxID=2835529 RepID=UPI001BD03354|nr:hypothetical protein [Flavobacterium sp. CYK-55]MBS7786168.1 hypothetical protein [Flavobacterium sp. CYK-55]
MNSTEKNNATDQEIDLAMVTDKLKSISGSIKKSIYDLIHFFIKKIVVIGALFVIGVGLGVYFDKSYKSYDTQAVVVPNYGSYEYLYSKIELIDSKIKERDTVFLKKIGVKACKNLIQIQIDPIIDVYQFINISPEKNFELLKLLSEDGDMNKIIKDEITSKNYTYHLLKYTTNKKCSEEEILTPLLKYLNNDQYYNKLKETYNGNMLVKIKANELIIAQIDGFLNTFSSQVGIGSKNDKLVYYNENTQLNDVIKTKNDLITEIGTLKKDMVSSDQVIKKVSCISNLKSKGYIRGKLKLIFPIFFIFIYTIAHSALGFYKTQSKLSQNN